ncbi:MAG: T9SS type A sorting domain-containing protein [Flavobacteriales bacterium]|jgi:polyhydroxybutyrate depolymerase|nr:T9SS type A sorting domain-containing protein [Flavobacteriales bacterium]
MKKIISALGILASLSLTAQTTTNDSIMHGGGYRTYKLYAPASYDGSTPVPVVLNLHGLGSNNNEQIMYGEFRPIADTANFLILLPQGTVGSLPGSGSATHWNANFGTSVNDIDFISNLIDSIATEYNVDEDRVYSTGMSNGGFMSLTLAGQLSDKIAAVASVTGSMVLTQTGLNTVTRPVPVMQIHGTSDSTVKYNGETFAYLGINNLINYWVGHNNCSSTPVVTPVPDVNTTDGCTATRYDYLNGDSGAEVVHYKITNGGHTWPGAFSIPGKVTNQDFHASTEIWKFFSKYSKASLVSVSEFEAVDGWMTLQSENPSRDIIKLASNNEQPYEVTIFNLEGKQVYSRVNNIGETTISVSDLVDGIYVVHVNNASQKATLKIVKQ